MGTQQKIADKIYQANGDDILLLKCELLKFRQGARFRSRDGQRNLCQRFTERLVVALALRIKNF
jgi:hypothetical protein